jgi:hypothetical protein
MQLTVERVHDGRRIPVTGHRAARDRLLDSF